MCGAARERRDAYRSERPMRCNKEVHRMAKKPKKPTPFEVAELILKALTAIAALVSAIKWW